MGLGILDEVDQDPLHAPLVDEERILVQFGIKVDDECMSPYSCSNAESELADAHRLETRHGTEALTSSASANTVA